MHQIHFVLLIMLAGVFAPAQISPPAPDVPVQTARQALLEMFLGKTPDAFAKHLPESVHHALLRKGDTITSSLMRQFAGIGLTLSSGGNKLETFDTGPTLAVIEDSNGGHKLEVLVDSDSLQGEEDVIELSFRAYQDGQFQGLPVVPRLTFSMTQEKDVWRVNELRAEGRIPLTDPDYLNGLRKEQNKLYERMAPMQIQMMVSAEKGYSQTHPAQGYTCKLRDVLGSQFYALAVDQGSAQPAPGTEVSVQLGASMVGQDSAPLDSKVEAGNQSPWPAVAQAAPSDPGTADGTKDGYVFSVSGCTGSPATKFTIAAVPQEDDSGMKAFCADESGTLRYAADGQAETCLSAGQPWK
jgi:hypothetical protein